MRKFNITVNGVAYDVAVDEIGGAPSAAPVVAAPVAAAAPTAAPAPAAAAPKAAAPANGTKVNAPMPGNILDVVVKVGDAVKSGQKLVVLEAMKMENEIVAPQAGTVSSVNVSKGDSVEAGQVIITMN